MCDFVTLHDRQTIANDNRVWVSAGSHPVEENVRCIVSTCKLSCVDHYLGNNKGMLGQETQNT